MNADPAVRRQPAGLRTAVTLRSVAWRRRRLAFVAALALGASALAAEPRYLPIEGASLRSVLPPDGKSAPAPVAPFELRALPVTNAEFRRFVESDPRWRRDRVARVFADNNYLAHWDSALAFDPELADAAVVNVSWFAAVAYCESERARLPRWHEWELAAAADERRRDARDDPAWRERILGWYSRPTGAVARVATKAANVYGVHDLHGLVWEWVDDYASLMVSSDNREQGDPDLLKYCGAGALSVADRENYAVLMRTALLSSLRAADTTRNLGFRCARDAGAVP